MISKWTLGGSFPALTSTLLELLAPCGSVAVRKTLYIPGLLNVTSGLAVLNTLVVPAPTTFHSKFKGSPSKSVVPPEERFTFNGTAPLVLLATASTLGFR